MPTILKKETLSPNVFRLRLDAPRIAKKRRAGQFIILRPFEMSERIPLTIADGNPVEGWIEIIFQAVGKTTLLLAKLQAGDSVLDLAGPLGRPTHIENFGRCLCIGGGVGIAPLYPIVKSLKEHGNHLTTILGARTTDLLLLESEMAATSDSVHIATDDGSKGTKGFVSQVAQQLFASGEKFDHGFVIGPGPMMKATSQVLLAAGIPTHVSLNPIMIDGTGMCGGCRVTIGGQTKFACVDGPEFEADKVDWDELFKRLSSYKILEEQARKDHACKVEA